MHAHLATPGLIAANDTCPHSKLKALWCTHNNVSRRMQSQKRPLVMMQCLDMARNMRLTHDTLAEQQTAVVIQVHAPTWCASGTMLRLNANIQVCLLVAGCCKLNRRITAITSTTCLPNGPANYSRYLPTKLSRPHHSKKVWLDTSIRCILLLFKLQLCCKQGRHLVRWVIGWR